MISPDSKQLLMFLLGQETGEVVRRFKNKQLTQAQYDAAQAQLILASKEVAQVCNCLGQRSEPYNATIEYCADCGRAHEQP